MMTLRFDLVFPRFKLLSGAERAILGLAGALAKSGHHPRIICHQFDDSCRELLAPGVELVRSNTNLDWSKNRYLNAISDYLLSFRLVRLLDPTADVRVVFGPALLITRRLIRNTRVRTPVIYYCWEPPRVLYQDRSLVLKRVGIYRHLLAPLLAIYRYVDRYLVSLADATCTSSAFAASQMQAVYKDKATVVTLGIDRNRLDAVAQKRLSEKKVILTVNYLHPRKRVDLIIRAASVLKKINECRDTYRWVVVGDGPERARLETLARDFDVADCVTFSGFVADQELPKYYAQASCYVHAAVEESLGLSVIEAAYCGCPVIAVNEGGVKETVKDGISGFLVPATAQDLANAVDSVLRSADCGREMGLSGRQLVIANHSWTQGAKDILKLVEKIGT